MSQDSDEQLVRKAVDDLIEHFDTCTVLVTRHDQASANGTVTLVMGAGNWFARYGQMKTWLDRQEHMNEKESSD